MTRHYCTLFDSNYLLKGLALHASLLRHGGDFRLSILCMDDASYALLGRMNLQKTELIQLADFENERLLAVKKGRSIAEYSWTCASSLVLFLLEKDPSLDMLAYIDADLFFYSSPEAIYQEFSGQSVMIIPHNFSENQEEQAAKNGIFNVGMVIFRNDVHGLEALRWWRDRCIEWCFNRREDGKFGDQMYLNDWPTRFGNVCVLKNRGANIASWNVKRFRFFEKGEVVYGIENGSEFPLVFYHFHGVRLYGVFGKAIPAPFGLAKDAEKIIFAPYEKALTESLRAVRKIEPKFQAGLDKNYIYFKKKIKRLFVLR